MGYSGIKSPPIVNVGVQQAVFDAYKAEEATKGVNIKGFGAHSMTEVGYETFDNITAINDAMAYAIANNLKYIYRPYGIYKVSTIPTFTAPMEFTGPGFFTVNDRVFDYIDRFNQLIFGMEYLKVYHTSIEAKVDTKIVFSGDSTTSNGQLVNYANDFIKRVGISTNTCVNAGHSGGNTSQWQSEGWLTADLALSPTLYVIRWGINDTSGDFTLAKVKEFEINLRTGLAQIRALKTSAQMSILLMTPNAVGIDYKDKKWGQQLNTVIRKAARDFQCCFADTYMYLEDVYNAPEWLDAQLIHPLPTGDRWIIDLISDILVPNTMRTYITNPPPGASYLKDVTDLPSTYPRGVSMYRTKTTGWVYDGSVTTFAQTGGVYLQINNAYDTTKTNQIAFRCGDPFVWGNWIDLYSGGITAPANSVALLASAVPSSFNTGLSIHRATLAHGFPNEGAVETMNYYNIAKQTLTPFDATNAIKIRTWNVGGPAWNAWKTVTTA